MKGRRLAVHVTANLVEVDGEQAEVIDQRQGTAAGADVERVRRQAHDMIDAYAFSLAQRVPPGPYQDGSPGVVADVDQLASSDPMALLSAVSRLQDDPRHGMTERQLAAVSELADQLHDALARRP